MIQKQQPDEKNRKMYQIVGVPSSCLVDLGPDAHFGRGVQTSRLRAPQPGAQGKTRDWRRTVIVSQRKHANLGHVNGGMYHWRAKRASIRLKYNSRRGRDPTLLSVFPPVERFRGLESDVRYQKHTNCMLLGSTRTMNYLLFHVLTYSHLVPGSRHRRAPPYMHSSSGSRAYFRFGCGLLYRHRSL